MGVRLVKYNTTSNGSSGTFDHNLMENREMDDQHPISAITGLEEALEEVDTNIENIHISLENMKFTLKDLDDTTIEDEDNAQIIMYNSTEEKWENKPNNVSLFYNDAGYIARHITASEMQTIWDDIEIDWR